MLTSLLRSNTILGFFAGWLLVAGYMLSALFMHAADEGLNDMLYGHWAFGQLESTQWMLPWIAFGLLAAATALLRVRTRDTRPVLGDPMLMTVSFTCIVATQPQTIVSRPDVVAAMLLVLVAHLLLLYTYKREKALSELFHSGLMVGLASIFWGQAIFLSVPLLFGLLMLRTGDWREWVVLFLGVLMVGVFIMLFTVWQESPFIGFQNVLRSSWSGTWATGSYTLGHYLIAIVALTSVGFELTRTSGTVAERNILLTNAGWLFSVMLVVLIFGLSWRIGFILASYPLSSFMARSIGSIQRWWLADLLLLMLLSAPFLSIRWPL